MIRFGGSAFFVCANDNEYCDDFERCKRKMNEALELRGPKKCEFEKYMFAFADKRRQR